MRSECEVSEDNFDCFTDEYREKSGLNPVTEDTLEVSKTMRASSPPPTAGADDNINQKRSRPFRRVRNVVISEVVSFKSILLLILMLNF